MNPETQATTGSSPGDAQPRTPAKPPLLKRRLFGGRLGLKTVMLCRFGIALPAAIIAIIAIVLHGILPRMIIASVGDSLNADVSAQSWQIGLDKVVLHDVTVRSRSVDGLPGEILTIGTLTADVEPTKLLGGVGAISVITLDQPTLRVSIDAAPSDRPRTNLSGLRLGDGGGNAAPEQLPAVYVQGGAIDWGEHTGASFRSLRRVRVEGALVPEQTASGPLLNLALREVVTAGAESEGGAPGGVVVTGSVASERLEVRLDNFAFDEWLPRAAPSAVQPLLADLDIQGNVAEVTIVLAGPGYERVTAVAELGGVALTLPLAQADQSEEALRLRETSGRLRLEQRQFIAEVAGELAGVPYAIELSADVRALLQGRVDESMPYSATVTVSEFGFGEDSDFLPFLPTAVREVLARFADRNQIVALSPTANVSAELRLSGVISGSDEGFGAAIPQTYRGIVRLSGGATAFYEFPYQFEDVRGEIEFDQNRLRIRSIWGVAPTGAVLSASGEVSPLGEKAGFDLEVEVFDIPIDHTFRAAMKPEHQAALREVLNEEHYTELVQRALVVPPGHREVVEQTLNDAVAELTLLGFDGSEAAGPTLAEVERMLRHAASAPEIELGGRLGLLLTLIKPPGGEGRWDTDIHADIADAVFVPEQFPLPIRVRDLAVRINDDVITITRGSAVPVNAISGSIEGTIDVAGPEPRPDLRFQADRLRAGELLNYAIGPAGRDPARVDAANVVRALGLHGDTDPAGVLWGDETGEPRFAVSMGLDRISVLTDPMPGRAPLILGDANGVAQLTHDGLTIQSDAAFTGISGDEAIERPTAVQLAIDLDWSDPSRDLVSTSMIGAQGMRASTPFEQIVHVFNTEAADAIAGLKGEFDPRGRGDAEVIITADGSGEAETTVELMGLAGVSVAQYGGRIACDRPTGSILIRAGAGDGDGLAQLELGDVTGSLAFGGEPAGRFRADGTLVLTPPDGSPRPSYDLNVGVTEGRFESALARAFVAKQIGGRFAEDYLSHDARGEFELEALLEPRIAPATASTPGIERIARPVYTLLPKWGTIFRRGQDVRVDVTEGAIVTVPGRTRIDGLRGDGNGFSVFADGSITADGFGGTGISVDLAVEAQRLTPDLRAVLLDKLDADLTKLAVECEGRIALSDATLTATTGESPSASFEGLLTFDNASMDLGMPVDRITGSARIETQTRPTDQPTNGSAPMDMLILARADRARAAGIELRDARVRVEGDADVPGRNAVPMFSASGRTTGRVWGDGVLTPTDDPTAPTYTIGASFTGFGLTAMQDELEAFGAGLATATELPAPRDDTGARIEGRVALAGTVEQDETRRGQVSLRIAGGELFRVPLLSRLIEVKALQPPTGESLDFATADLAIDGNTIVSEHISVQSKTVEVFGFGLITLPTFDLDMVLYTRSISPLPIISRFADVLLDEFGKVSITGTAKEPQASVLVLPSSRRLLGSIMAGGDTAGTERLDQIERRALEIRDVRGRYRDARPPRNAVSISAAPTRLGNDTNSNPTATPVATQEQQ